MRYYIGHKNFSQLHTSIDYWQWILYQNEAMVHPIFEIKTYFFKSAWELDGL